MHIVYLHQYFATPEGKTGTRSYEFARRWAKAGCKVTIICSSAQLTSTDLRQAEKINKKVFKLSLDGMDVIIIDIPYHQTMSYSERIKAFIRFSLYATYILLKIKKVDIIYATSTPLTIAIPALIKRKLHKVDFVFEVRDLWPLVPISLGVINNKLLKYILFGFEKIIYKNAKGIVALSPTMKEYIDKVTQMPSKTIVVPNCSDTDLFLPLPEKEKKKVKESLGWEDRFVIVHTGAIGKVNGLYRVIHYAQKLKDPPFDKILFVIIGEGKEKENLIRLKDNYKLDNIQFLDPLPKKRLKEILPAADLGFVSIDKIKILEANSANKLFDYLAAGLPVIINYGGWQKKVLEDYNAGLGVDDFDEEMLVENIKKFFLDKDLREKAAHNARKLAETKFSREKLAQKVLTFLEGIHSDKIYS